MSYKELLSYICTGGEGKGRLKIFDKSYSFGFESHTTEKKLTLGLQIPFHGEEMLVIEFEPQIKVTGSFYHLISKEIQDKEEFQSLLKRVFYVYGYSLKSLQGEKDRDLFVYEKGRLTFKNPKQGVAVSHSRLKKYYFSHQSINMQIDGETVAMVDMVYKKCYEAFFKSL